MKLSNPDKQVPILLFTPPPVDEVTWTKFSRKPEANRKNLVTRDYGIRVHDVARYMNCSVVDTWELLEGSNATVYSQYLTDGLHLNERGNRVLYQGLMDLIQTEYPPLAPQRGGQLHGIPFEEPAWQEYD